MGFEIQCIIFVTTDLRKPVTHQALQSRSIWPDLPRCPCSGPFARWHLVFFSAGETSGAPRCGWVLGHQRHLKQVTCSNQSGFSKKQNKTKQGQRSCGVWIFSSELPPVKTAITSRIKQTLEGKDGFLLSFVAWYPQGLLAPGERVGEGRSGRCSVYVLCMPLPWWTVWFGLFPPLPLILCILFPLCCTIRTLQWDTDPSVLQLQSDSELGYMSALLLLLLLFLCYSCVEMLEPLLLLFFPFCWTSSLISLFPSVTLPYKVKLWRKSLFVENATKRWLLVSLS